MITESEANSISNLINTDSLPRAAKVFDSFSIYPGNVIYIDWRTSRMALNT